MQLRIQCYALITMTHPEQAPGESGHNGDFSQNRLCPVATLLVRFLKRL